MIEGIESNKLIPKEYRKSKSKLFMENDLLMYNHRNNYLVVCPSELKSEISDLSHSQWCSGHFDIFKTHKCVLVSFWWPGLYSDIVNCITQCEVCIYVKPLNQNSERIGILSFPSSLMELVSIYFLVDLPITHGGNRYILSINDQFSKFTQLYAVPDCTAAISAKCVFDYFLKFGIAKKSSLLV